MIHLSACKICASQKIVSLRKYRVHASDFVDLQAAVGDREVRVHLCLCVRCGFLFYNNVLSPEEMERLYVSEGRGVEPKKDSAMKAHLLTKARGFLAAHFTWEGSQKVIDVGAGDFSLLQGLSRDHPGVQPSAINVCYASERFENIRVYHQMLENFRAPEKFQVIILSHILEHIADFEPFFRALEKLCDEHSELYVEVPFQLAPPLFLKRNFHTQHINYFSPRTLTTLLGKYGYRVRAVEFDRAGYKVYGIPGVIRMRAVREAKKEAFQAVNAWSTLGYLLDPRILATLLNNSRYVRILQTHDHRRHSLLQ